MDAGRIAVVIVAVFASAVGAFYYLRVIKLMYFDAPAEDAQSIDAAPDLRVVMSLNAWAMVLLLPWIGPIQELCLTAIDSVMNGFAS